MGRGASGAPGVTAIDAAALKLANIPVMRAFHFMAIVPILVACNRSQPVSTLTEQDYRAITNAVRADTRERILDVRLTRGSVIVDTGPKDTSHHCYELKKTGKGWKIVWKGT
jgi:hypothetical protein